MGDETMQAVAVHRGEISGIPVFWSEVPGERQVALMFRVGRVDEAPVSAGLSHLVEHLTLFPLGRGLHPYNGFVDDTRTVFHATGTRQETADFLSDVVANLGDLSLDRLEQERGVLLTEGYGRPEVTPHRRLRFGVTGYGAGALGELGLHSLGEAQVGEWARERFTRGNAAIWCSGPPPEIALELPDGERFPPPQPEPLRGLELPAFSAQGQGGAAISWMGARSTPLNLGTSVARAMAEDRLRHSRGVSYEVGSAYEYLGAETALCVLGADCLPEHAATVRDTLIDVLDEVAAGGAPSDQVDLIASQWRRFIADPMRAAAMLDGAAEDELFGREGLSGEQLLAEIATTDAAGLAAAIGAALPTLLLLVPAGVGADRSRFTFLGDEEAHEAVEGKAFHRAAKLERMRGAKQELILGEDGISYVNAAGAPTTIRFDECVAVAEEGNGYRVHARDGSWIFARFDSEEERREIVRILSSGAPPQLWVETDKTFGERLRAVDAKLRSRALKAGADGHRAASNLAKILLDGEQLVEVALVELTGSEGKRLFAVTDMRVAWLTGSENDTLQAAVESITSVAAKGKLLNRKVVLSVGQERVEMTAVGGASPSELTDAINAVLPAGGEAAAPLP